MQKQCKHKITMWKSSPIWDPTRKNSNDLKLLPTSHWSAKPAMTTDRQKFAFPALLDDIILWYHQALNHIGMKRLWDTINAHFWHPRVQARVEQLIKKMWCMPTIQFLFPLTNTRSPSSSVAWSGSQSNQPLQGSLIKWLHALLASVNPYRHRV